MLLHPLLIGSLFLLLLNDAFWKAHYPNMLTGKLSDVAGLVVLPVCCRVLFPNASKLLLLLSCAVFFLWWKSPLSQPVIDALNNRLHWPVQRTVDYTDDLALVVLPVAFFLKPKTGPWRPWAETCFRWTVGALACFSLCATSMPYRSLFMAHPDSRDTYFHQSLSVKGDANSVRQILQRKGIPFGLDSVMYYPVLNQQSLYYRRTGKNDSAVVWQPLTEVEDATLYIRQQGSPYYLIPVYRGPNSGDTLRNIRFTLAENKKGTKTTITVETFEGPGLRPYLYLDKQTRNTFKKLFETLFLE